MFNISSKLISVLLLCTTFFTFTAAPALAAVTYLYDANGNQTSDGTNCYTYNEDNDLTQVRNCSNGQLTAEYVYDDQGIRGESKIYVNGVLDHIVYTPSKDYETTKNASTGALQQTVYYYVNDQIAARKNPDGTKTFYHEDNLNSTSVLTNQSGQLVEKTTYYPFGGIQTGGTQSKVLYTGQRNDSETGLDYYNARYYNPQIRRFTQPDDIYPDVYNPQSLNRYSYVNNNPLRYTDPSGHCIWDLCIVEGIGVIELGAFAIGGILAIQSAFHPAQTAKAITSIVASSSNTILGAMNNWQNFYKQVNNFLGNNNENKSNNQSQTKTVARGSNNPIVRNALRIGQQAHNDVKPNFESRGYNTTFRFQNGLRTDGINFDINDIIEYKPNTTSGIAKGVKQLPGYIDQANLEMPLPNGESWTGHVEYYDPNDYLKAQ